MSPLHKKINLNHSITNSADDKFVIFFLFSPDCSNFSKKICFDICMKCQNLLKETIFVCVEVLRPSQPNGVMSSAVSLPNHTFTGQA